MRVSRDEEYRRRLIDRLRDRLGVDRRRPGVHVSDLLYCARKAWHQRRADRQVDDATVLLWSRGRSHEDLMAGVTTQQLMTYCFTCRKVEVLLPDQEAVERCPACGDDLLIGTADWVEDDLYGIVEAKSTMQSSRKGLEEMAWYADQALAYAWMYGRPGARVVVYHVNGDWKGEKGMAPNPELAVYRVEFEGDEERRLVGERLRRRQRLALGEREPPLDGVDSPAYAWACKYCEITACPRNPRGPGGPGLLLAGGIA